MLTNLAPVAKSLMEKAGFKVDMQSMDWQTLVARRAKKDPPDAGGWNAFLTSWVAADIAEPGARPASSNAACDKAMFGWPCDDEMEKLRDDFARETDPAKQKAIAEAVQVRDTEVTTHIHARPMVPARRHAQERQRHAHRAGAGVLERREEGLLTSPERTGEAGARFADHRARPYLSRRERSRRRSRPGEGLRAVPRRRPLSGGAPAVVP